MFDWPSSPVENQLYQPVGGPQYIYKAPAWRVNMPPSAVVTDYQRRNRLINGAFQISQEFGSAAQTTSGTHPADQWQMQFSGTFTGLLGARTVNNTLTPNGGGYSLNIGITTNRALAAGEYYWATQYVEGVRVADFQWGTAFAKQVILRFWAFCNVAGNYSAIIRNTAPDRSWTGLFNIAAGELNKWVERSFVIPGDTLGVWAKDGTKGLDVGFTLCCGTTLTAAAPGWGAGNKIACPGQSNGTGASLYIGDVGLYLDASNTGVAPRWEMPDEAEELRACQRYFLYRTYAAGGLWVYSIDNAALYRRSTYHFPVTMRTAPAITVTGAAGGTFAASMPQASPGGTTPFSCELQGDLAGAGFAYITSIKVNARM